MGEAPLYKKSWVSQVHELDHTGFVDQRKRTHIFQIFLILNHPYLRKKIIISLFLLAMLLGLQSEKKQTNPNIAKPLTLCLDISWPTFVCEVKSLAVLLTKGCSSPL